MRTCANASDARLLGVDDYEAGRGMQLDIPAPLGPDYLEAYREAAEADYDREQRAWVSALARRSPTTQPGSLTAAAGQTEGISEEGLEPLRDGSGCRRISQRPPADSIPRRGFLPGDGA